VGHPRHHFSAQVRSLAPAVEAGQPFCWLYRLLFLVQTIGAGIITWKGLPIHRQIVTRRSVLFHPPARRVGEFSATDRFAGVIRNSSVPGAE